MKAVFFIASGAALAVTLFYLALSEVEQYIDDIRRNTEDDE